METQKIRKYIEECSRHCVQDEVVYVLECNGALKIGVTIDYKARMKQHFSSNPFLNPIGLIHGGGTVEKRLHELLREARLPGQREWFDLRPFPALEEWVESLFCPTCKVGEDGFLQWVSNYLAYAKAYHSTGELLRFYRKHKKLSVDNFAHLLSCSADEVRKLERGKKQRLPDTIATKMWDMVRVDKGLPELPEPHGVDPFWFGPKP